MEDRRKKDDGWENVPLREDGRWRLPKSIRPRWGGGRGIKSYCSSQGLLSSPTALWSPDFKHIQGETI